MDPIVKFVRRNSDELRRGGKTIREVFDIIFWNEGNIMAEKPAPAGIVSVTYGEAKKRIARAAGNISARLGRKGEFIGLWGENSVEWLVGFWAILKSGNKPYLINLMQPVSFTEDILRTLGADTVIHTGKAPKLSASLVSLESLETGQSDPVPPEVFGDEIALTTSGTTLKEKICIYSGREITEQILNCDSIIDLNPDIKAFYHGRLKMLMFLPLYHIFGLEAAYLWFAFGNITFVFLPSYSPEAIMHTIRRCEVTHIFAVPLFWHTIEKAVLREVKAKGDKTYEKFLKGLDLSEKLQTAFPKLGKRIAARLLKEVRQEVFGDSVIFCITGGSHIRSSALRLVNCLGYSLYNGYGMSELGITSVELSMRIKDRLKGSIGKPFESIEYRLKDDGSLLVKGSSVCKKVIVDGLECEANEWFDTGDVMHRDADGRYYIDGRMSDVVISDNGENLNPDVVEMALDIPGASAYTVLGDERNEKLILIVSMPRTLLDAQREKLARDTEESVSHLPSGCRISRVYYTYDPLMEEGGIKISREYVRRRLASGAIELFDSVGEAGGSVGSIDTEIKAILVKLFADVLDIKEEDVRPDAHFMNELGGSSLDYFTLIGEIDKRFDVKLSFGEDDFAYTLNDFAAILEKLIKEL
ncbi:MAG: AMP-binding protein [Clostridiales bacterium]|nr:AMP-binding protein [Clostridiales bacterium]